VSVILFEEHGLDVELLGRGSVELRTCCDSRSGLILDRVGVAVGVCGDYNDQLRLIRWIGYGDGDYIIECERLLVHTLHGAGLSRSTG